MWRRRGAVTFTKVSSARRSRQISQLLMTLVLGYFGEALDLLIKLFHVTAVHFEQPLEGRKIVVVIGDGVELRVVHLACKPIVVARITTPTRFQFLVIRLEVRKNLFLFLL